MDRTKLNQYLEELVIECKDQDKKLLQEKLESLTLIFPAADYEYMIVFLRDKQVITAEQYTDMKKKFQEANKNLIVYGISSRMFAEIWAVEQLKRIDVRFKTADKSLDAEYVGQYEAVFETIKLGVKASRSMNPNVEGDRFQAALRYNLTKPFVIRFRQLMPEMCEVFVLIGVWIDRIVYWVLSVKELKEIKYLIKEEKFNMSYVLTIDHRNIAEFEKFIMPESEITNAIVVKTKKF
ncbi:MAG: hypothetical protein WDL87_10655 [Candidatus Omnitrophota bacterium]|jgi:hypothetical protein